MVAGVLVLAIVIPILLEGWLPDRGAPDPPPPPPPLVVPLIAQRYNLSCEAAALEMTLAARGLDISQDEILTFIGADTRPPRLRDGAVVAWGNPFRSFVGDVRGHEYDHTGYGVYAPPIAAAAEHFGARVRASGSVPAAELYADVAAGHPAVAWVPFDGSRYLQTGPLAAYTAWDGTPVPYGPGYEHAVAVAGVNGGAILLDNPRWGFASWLSKPAFERLYAVFGEMAVVLE